MNQGEIKQYYQSYREIYHDIFASIDLRDHGLLVELYKSKLIFLEDLQHACFLDLNRSEEPVFSSMDHQQIIQAITIANTNLRQIILGELNHSRI